jgi:Holliday junction resolvase
MANRYERSIIPDSVIKSISGRIAFRRGERGEQRAMTLLQNDGWECARTRKGPIDVVAGKGGRVLLIQVKSGKARISRTGLSRVVDWGRAFDADAEIWYFRGRGRVVRRRVYAKPRIPAGPPKNA